MSETTGGFMKGKAPIVIGVIVVLIAVAVLIGVMSSGSGGEGPTQKVHYKCSECGHEWDARPTAEPKCPKCGAPAVSEAWFKCPRCGEVFVGLETRKLGVGKFEYREPGASKWMRMPPTELTCPKCGLKSGSIYKYAVTAEGKPVSTGDDAARRGRD